ncbi:MAG: sugar phosphate nucleotidyltransferase [Desulfitobacteriaceae bacterium]
MQAVILAGGRGSRLDPYSRVLPKPLFPVGQDPIAAILVKQLQKAGVKEIIMCLGYLADLMMAYFQDGSRFGIPIRYVIETSPLGTAGPLKIISGLVDDFLVVNGDELTTLDFCALFAHHLQIKAEMTVAVQQKIVPSSFGVLNIKDGRVIAYREKPTFNYWASMGIYVLSNKVIQIIPDNKRFDMPDLVQNLLKEQARIVSFESEALWFDIGTLDDLEKAQVFFNKVNLD